uniref:Uncharacterized protein n=1 Tax=Anguilla anguilla TaxID=7936 RepID=A0A0E9UMG8_ANGAN
MVLYKQGFPIPNHVKNMQT